MSECFRKFIARDPPPSAGIKFRCAKLHRATIPGSDTSVLEYNTIYDVLRYRGWKDAETEGDWHIFWADKDWIHDSLDKMHLDPHQHVNHFRNHYELTRKDLLAKNMKRIKRACEKDGRTEEAQKYNICPVTFVVPQEYSMFVEEFKKHPGATWIMKPVGRSQGAGIFLVNKLAQVQQWKPPSSFNSGTRKEAKDLDDDEAKETPEHYVCQKYVEGPLLIGGKKFDIRLYVLCMSYQPLTIYMHRGGFCRFSMSKYSSDKSDMKNLGSHLTNIAVQKQSAKAAYKRTGAKWDMACLKNHLLATAGVDIVNRLSTDIESIVINSLLSVQKVMINDKHCFELYGYDILIDTEYKPWLLEVNASPSLTANTDADYDMKFGMLDDVLSIIDIENYLMGTEPQVGGFDILYKDGLRYGPPDGSAFTSYLGCANDRLEQLPRLAKSRAWKLSREGGESGVHVRNSGATPVDLSGSPGTGRMGSAPRTCKPYAPTNSPAGATGNK